MYRLLIADDEYPIREGLKHLIVETFDSIKTIALAEDGETALRLIGEFKPDIVILDINLPDMSGLEVARLIRENDSDIPLLFLTGYESFAYIREAVGLQAADYLLKPVTKDELASGLRRATDSLQRWKRAEDGIEQSNRKQRAMAQEYALLDLLLQRRFVDDTIEQLLILECPALAGGGPFVVLCCDLDAMPDSVTENGDAQLFGYAFCKLATEAAAAVTGALGAVISPDRVIIVLAQVGIQTAADVVLQVRSVLTETLDISVTVGISRKIHHLSKLSEGYREAVHAAEHKGWVGNGQVIPFESVQIAEMTQQVLLDKELILISEIRAGNDGAVSAILRTWSAQLTEMPSRQVKLMATQLVLFVMRVVQSLRLHDEHGDRQYPLLALSQMQNGNEIIRYVSSYFVQVGRLIRESREAVVPRMFEQAKAWVRERLHEDASLNGLARHLHLSPKYLSSRFKQVTGENFADFLTRVRFERARELLLDPDRKVGEVAEAVGFGDTNYFSIAFKKNTGLTPTEFRKRYL
ncbi:helix-turn-helix domain-containing protein [Cohnella suwonensis]|uniref:Helix-turn-helix domain-containing protein n=1 Tax=Cohnella suwonensis TaxID=696072 RepID=A0ABW0LUN7_9BACL